MSEAFNSIRSRVKGAVYPVLPAYAQDGSLDARSVAEYVRYLVAEGAKMLMVTAGTSRLNLLTVEETAELNRAVAEAAGSGSMVIGATPPFGGLKTAVDLTVRAVADGCDAVLLYYPERHYHDSDVVDYFRFVAAESSAPLMIHGVPLTNGRGPGSVPYPLSMMQELAGVDAIVGMKEEFGNEDLRYKLAVHFNERIPLIVAGASMRKYLSCALFGVKSWLVGVGSFVPREEEAFFAHTEKGDYAAALDIVTRAEEPLFDVAMGMGWHVAMRGMLDVMGLMPGRERPPMPQADEDQKTELEKLALRLGWISQNRK